MNGEVSATTRESTLILLLKQGESSAAQLAGFIGISVQAMRRHLRILEEDGLVESTQIAVGPGRPFNLWQLTMQGQTRFNDDSQRFALDLLSSINATLSPEIIDVILAQQALKKASFYRNQMGPGTVEDRLVKLVELRNEEGYLAESHQAEDGSGWYLKEFHCSISRIAENFPIVCDQELQMIRQTFPDCEVNRVQWRLECGHSCGFHIAPNS